MDLHLDRIWIVYGICIGMSIRMDLHLDRIWTVSGICTRMSIWMDLSLDRIWTASRVCIGMSLRLTVSRRSLEWIIDWLYMKNDKLLTIFICLRTNLKEKKVSFMQCHDVCNVLRNDALKINENVICVSVCICYDVLWNAVWMKYVIKVYR